MSHMSYSSVRREHRTGTNSLLPACSIFGQMKENQLGGGFNISQPRTANHYITYSRVLPSTRRRKPPTSGILACAKPFSRLGANGDDLAKQMMVVLYWRDRPYRNYHHPRAASRFSKDVTQSPSFASVLLCWAMHAYVMHLFGVPFSEIANIACDSHILHHWLCTLIGRTLRWWWWRHGNGL